MSVNDKQYGNPGGAYRQGVGTFTAPPNTVIYHVVPDPSFTGRAIAEGSGPSMTLTRTAAGGNVVNKLAPFYGRYKQVIVTSGFVDIYVEQA
jgi:hypothetical protein